jgi:hypothetical protein
VAAHSRDLSLNPRGRRAAEPRPPERNSAGHQMAVGQGRAGVVTPFLPLRPRSPADPAGPGPARPVAIRLCLWTADGVHISFEGEFFHLPPMNPKPRPVRRPSRSSRRAQRSGHRPSGPTGRCLDRLHHVHGPAVRAPGQAAPGGRARGDETQCCSSGQGGRPGSQRSYAEPRSVALSAQTLHDGTPLGRRAAFGQFPVSNFPSFAGPSKAVTVVAHNQ